MKYKLDIIHHDGYIHYYLDKVYIGMLVFDKGEVSDFRAIIRKNRLNMTSDSLYNLIKTSLYGLLNHYLEERFFIKKDEIEELKSSIVKNNDIVLQDTATKIVNDGGTELSC